MSNILTTKTYTVNQADIHSETSLHYSPAFESWGSPQGLNYDTNVGTPLMLYHRWGICCNSNATSHMDVTVYAFQ